MLLLAALTAALTLSLAVGTATATRLRFSSTSYTIRWRSFEFATGAAPARCAVTLSGSFHSTTIAKNAGSLVGLVNSVQVAPCSEGRATLLRETLPWHVTYKDFRGVLPVISAVGVSIIGWSASIYSPILGATCLMRSSTTDPFIVELTRENGGAVTAARAPNQLVTDCGYLWAVDSGSTSTVENGAGRSITITLI